MSHLRDYKPFASGGIYHVYNRGNAKMSIFLDDGDYKFFLERLREALYPELEILETVSSHIGTEKSRRLPLPWGAFDLICYCLMPNHKHLVIQQNTDLPVGKLIHKVVTSYSMYFNKKYDRVGSLFQDQFKAVKVDSNEQLLCLVAYIHNNPIKAGIARDLSKYPYSSHFEYAGSVKSG